MTILKKRRVPTMHWNWYKQLGPGTYEKRLHCTSTRILRTSELRTCEKYVAEIASLLIQYRYINRLSQCETEAVAKEVELIPEICRWASRGVWCVLRVCVCVREYVWVRVSTCEYVWVLVCLCVCGVQNNRELLMNGLVVCAVRRTTL
jgi:hypothetical protein